MILGKEMKAGEAFDVEKEVAALNAMLAESVTNKELGWKKRVE